MGRVIAVRDELRGIVDTVTGYLRDSISVNVVGLRQSGRSFIAALVAEELRESDYTVLSICGIAAFGDRPLAALALAGIELPPGGAPTSISGAVDALRKALPPPQSVLVVDDADDLDSLTAGVVSAARTAATFPVLSITRHGARGASASRWRSADFQPGVRITLEPLNFDQINRLVHRALPGPVDISMVGRIATASGGLPGLVVAIIDSGRRSGVIAEERGVWNARGGLWNNALAPAVDPLIGDLADEDVEALTKLAVAGTVPVTAAQQIVPDQLFLRLNALGLLQVVQAAPNAVTAVYPPLLASYLRRTGAVASLLASSENPRPAEDSPPHMHPSRVGLTVPRAAILNAQIVDHWQGEVALRRAAWSEQPSARNAVRLLLALNEAGAEPGEFAAVFDGTTTPDDDPAYGSRFAAWRAAHRALALGDFGGAHEVLVQRRAADPASAPWLRAWEANLRMLAGRLPDADLLAPPGPDADPAGAEALAVMRIAVLLAQGKTADALAALPDSLPAAPYHAQNHQVAVGLARVLHGEFDDGVQWALGCLDDAETQRSIGDMHAHAYVAALGLTFAGRLDELDALLARVLTLSGTTMFSEQYRVGTLGLAALAAGWAGHADYLWSLSVQAEAAGRRQGPFPGMTHGVTPLVAELQDNVSDAGRRLWRAVSDRLDNGFVAAGVTLAVTAVEAWPDKEQAAAAIDLARGTQSPFLAALGDYIAATADGDPDALAGCVADLSARGARVHALKAAVACALALRARGDIEASARQAEAAWARAAGRGERFRGLFFRLGRAVGLTAREREIVLMIVDGMSVQSIAAALSLSPRTVENYLFAAYRKLGSEGRDDMVRAVSTWAALR